MLVPIFFLIFVLFVFKLSRWSQIPELSNDANGWFRKYGHIYQWPHACRDYYRGAQVLSIVVVLISIISAFKGFWWGC